MRKHPKFQRPNVGRLKRLKKVWRKPRGIDSKQRMRRKSAGAVPKIGWRNPKSERGIHPSGYKEVLVHNAEELRKINPSVEAARIAAGVGERKRAEMRKAAAEEGIKILNP